MFYIDEDYRCHTSDPEEKYRAIEKDIFPGKCDSFIEGYLYIPSGESWEREDGVVFYGEMISPWKNYDELDAAQREHEQEKLADAENALAILFGGVT